MAEKKTLKVLIDGKTITLAGYEDEEYMQSISNYINRKISGFNEIPGYRRMTADTRSTLLALNIADDYFKAKNAADVLEETMEAREQDAYALRQDLVSAQMESERLKTEVESLKNEIERIRKGQSGNTGSGGY